MVTEYGMSDELGLVSFASNQEVFIAKDWVISAIIPRRSPGKVDAVIRSILDNASVRANKIIRDNEDGIDRVVVRCLSANGSTAKNSHAFSEANNLCLPPKLKRRLNKAISRAVHSIVPPLNLRRGFTDMEFNFKIGTTYETKTVVSQSNSAKTLGSGGLDVFGTPGMIALMENASFLLANHSFPKAIQPLASKS